MNAIECILLTAERGGLEIRTAGMYLLLIARGEHKHAIENTIEYLAAMSPGKRKELALVALKRVPE